MNENKVTTTVRHLLPGDVVMPTHFTITRTPYQSVRAGRGKMVVSGYYKDGEPTARIWNAGTTMRVLRQS